MIGARTHRRDIGRCGSLLAHAANHDSARSFRTHEPLGRRLMTKRIIDHMTNDAAIARTRKPVRLTPIRQSGRHRAVMLGHVVENFNRSRDAGTRSHLSSAAVHR